MHNMSTEMKICISNCLSCYSECLSMAMGHCLELGGEHTRPPAVNAPKSAPNALRIASGSVTCRAASMLAAAAPKAAARWRPDQGRRLALLLPR